MSAGQRGGMPAGFAPWLGVFETLRVQNGRAEFVDEHWRNLQAAAKALGLRVTADLRQTGSKLPRQSGRLRWVVEATESCATFHPQALRVKASFSLSLAPQRVGSENWDARYKTLSYLTHWQARHAVRTDEALLLNERGQIASGAMSNIFWVSQGKLFTPALGAGCRNGVVRQWVLRHAQVQEGAFPVETLKQAEEIFLTNSWIGIRPVTRSTGAVAKRLQREFERQRLSG